MCRALIRGPRWLASHLLVGLVRVYQYTLSPLLGPRCRFWPSCSAYAVEAIQVHGPLKGTWMAIKRILKCHPGVPVAWTRCPADAAKHFVGKTTKATATTLAPFYYARLGRLLGYLVDAFQHRMQPVAARRR